MGTRCLSEEAAREGCLYAFTSTLPSFALLFQPLLERVAEGVDRRAAQRTPIPQLKEIQAHQAAFGRTHEGLRPLHFLGQQDLAEAGSHAAHVSGASVEHTTREDLPSRAITSSSNRATP